MKSCIATLVPVLSFAIFLNFVSGNVIAQTSSGVIEGSVVNSVTQEPLANTQITLIALLPGSVTVNMLPAAAARLADQTALLIGSKDGMGRPTAYIESLIASLNAGGVAGADAHTSIVADNEGRFSLRGLAPGRYILRAARKGFFGPPLNGTAVPAITEIISVGVDTTTHVEFALTQGTIIAGTVKSPTGQAVAGIQVVAYRVTYSNGRKIWTSVDTMSTNDRGEYRIFGLPPGEYYLGVMPRLPGPAPGPQDSWSRTFFPGVTEPEDAVLVPINHGEATGIDINILSSVKPVFKISGVVRNRYARPDPLTGVVDRSFSVFILSPQEPGLLDPVNPRVVENALGPNARSNGEFEIRNVRPGTYDLIPYYLEKSYAMEPTDVPTPVSSIRRYMLSHNPIEVRNADVTGITLSINLGMTVSGEVMVSGSGPQPIKLESVRLSLHGSGTLPTAFLSDISVLQVDAAGKFTTVGVPQDRYRFTVTGIPDTAFVADVRRDGASVFDSGFTLDNPNPLQVVLDPGGVQVDGMVMTVDRKPAPGATVVLVPPAARRQNPLLYKTTQSNETGSFTLNGVAPGQYLVYAWESIPPNAWQNAEYLNNFEGRGRPLIVDRQSKPEIEAPLISNESPR